MNRVEGISLFEPEEHRCSFCGMDQEQSSGCCHQEKQLVKLVQDQCPPQFVRYVIGPATVFVLPVQPLTPAVLYGYSLNIDRSVQELSEISSPPLYVTNRVFRI